MAKFDIDEDLIRRLATLIEETGLTEVELAEGDRRVRVARQSNTLALAAPGMLQAPGAAPCAPARAQADAARAGFEPSHPGAILSPMVGTAYLQSKPGSPRFVQIGDSVREGQTLLIVEAMKVMNPIPSPRSGHVTEILIDDAQPVEYGQVLMIVE